MFNKGYFQQLGLKSLLQLLSPQQPSNTLFLDVPLSILDNKEFTFVRCKATYTHSYLHLKSVMGSRDGAVVRALASHRYSSGSIARLGVIYGLSFLLVIVLALRGFSPGTPVFLSPLKPFKNSNSIRRVSPISALR